MIYKNNELELNKMLNLLRKYSIIDFDIDIELEYEDQIIRIHSLTQLFIESNHTYNDISNQLKKIAHIFIRDLIACESNKDSQAGKYWLNHFFKIYDDEVKKPLLTESFLGNEVLLSNLLKTRRYLQKAP